MVLDRKTNFFFREKGFAGKNLFFSKENDGFGQKNQFFSWKKDGFEQENQLFPGKRWFWGEKQRFS